MGFVLFNGEPGEVWTNQTGRAAYQLIVAWANTCGVCAQYDHAIGNSWPIPFHYGCRCVQHLILPDQSAEPFVDFRAEVAKLDPREQVHIVGASNYALIDQGVVKWEDVVTSGRIRTLREVVSREQLSVKTLTDAGVSKSIAEEAYKSVHTASHAIAEETRRQAIQAVTAKGVTVTETRKLVAERLAARVTIGAGPSGPQGTQVKLTPVPKGPATKVVKKLTRKQVEAIAGVKLKAPAKPPEPPRVRGETTLQEYLDLRERVAKLPEFSPERRAHVMEWVRERATETTTSQRMHGMTDAEDLHSLVVDDVRYHFPALPSAADIAKGKVMEAERVAINARIDALYREKAAIDARWTRENPLNEQRARVEADLAVADVELKRIMGLPPAPDIRHPFVSTLTNFAEEPELPRALRGITKEVVFSRQRSKDDPHYAVEYKKPNFKSSATGGDGNVVVYNGQMIDVRAFAHETAHNFATVKSKLRGDNAGTNPGPAYRLAMASGEPPVTDYAKNSPSEDFAEAVQYYVVSPRNMETVAPRRYNVIKRLMEEPGYGG